MIHADNQLLLQKISSFHIQAAHLMGAGLRDYRGFLKFARRLTKFKKTNLDENAVVAYVS